MIPKEETEQIAFVNWLEAMNIKFSAIPSSTYTKSWSVKNRNTRMGVRPGVPDLMIALPGVGIVWIELKRQKGGVVSQYQKDWIATLNACPGTQAFIAKGCDEAIAIIKPLLNLVTFEPAKPLKEFTF